MFQPGLRTITISHKRLQPSDHRSHGHVGVLQDLDGGMDDVSTEIGAAPCWRAHFCERRAVLPEKSFRHLFELNEHIFMTSGQVYKSTIQLRDVFSVDKEWYYTKKYAGSHRYIVDIPQLQNIAATDGIFHSAFSTKKDLSSRHHSETEHFLALQWCVFLVLPLIR